MEKNGLKKLTVKQIREMFLLSRILWEFLVGLHIYSPVKSLIDELKYKVGNNFLCALLQKSNHWVVLAKLFLGEKEMEIAYFFQPKMLLITVYINRAFECNSCLLTMSKKQMGIEK